MSGWKQIWHVAKKDMRQFRWILGLQLAVVGVATFAAVDPGVHRADPSFLYRASSFFDSWYVAIAVLTALVTAMVVQADSPSRSDAFWASRPLSPIAVLMAKLMTLTLFFVAAPALGQIFAFSQHAVSADQMIPLLAEGVGLQFAIIMGAAILAALTTSIATFLVAGFGTGVAMLVVVGAVEKVIDGAFRSAGGVEAALPLLVVGGALLAYQYRTRNLRRSVISAAVAGLVGLVLVGWVSAAPFSFLSLPETAALDVPRGEVQWGELELDPVSASWAGQSREWSLHASLWLSDTDPRLEYALIGGTARLRLADGTVLEQRLGRVRLARATQRPGANTWLEQQPVDESPEVWTRVARLSDTELRVLETQGGSLEIDGRIELVESEQWGAVPLETGAVRVHDATTVSVLSVGSPRDGAIVEILDERTRGYETDGAVMSADYTWYGLASPSTGEAVVAPASTRLVRRHAVVLEGGWTIGTSVGITVPWTVVDGEQIAMVDAEWLDGAELLVMHTKSAGGYRFTATLDDVRIGQTETEAAPAN